MKRPDGIKDWITFILTIVAIIASVCFAYGVLNQKVNVIEVKAEKALIKDEIQDGDIRELKTDIKYIRKGVDDIQQTLKEK